MPLERYNNFDWDSAQSRKKIGKQIPAKKIFASKFTCKHVTLLQILKCTHFSEQNIMPQISGINL